MITFSIIQKSKLEGAQRIDAEYYQPEYLRIGKLLSNSPTINDIANTYDLQSNGAFKDIFSILNDDNPKTIPYIRSEDAGDFFINKNELAFISKLAHSKLKKTQTKVEDIVMARKGKIGGATLITEDAVGFNSNDNIVNIKIRDKNKIDPYYFVTFFNSRIGLKQVERLATGNVQPWLSMYQLRSLRIFISEISFQKIIREKVKSAHVEMINTNNFYREAERILLKEIGLNNFNPKDDVSYVVNASEVKNANRIDADFYQPKYNELISRIKKYGYKQLSEIIQNIPAKFSPLPEKKYNYVELANINSTVGVIDGFEEVLGKEAPSRAKRILKANDVIISSVEGSLDKVAIVSEDQANFIASTGFFQLRSYAILPETLLILAKSIIMQLQMKKYAAGTILAAVPSESLNKIVVPVLPKAKQLEIAELVKKSHEARKKSKEILEQAKREVEEMIEKGN